MDKYSKRDNELLSKTAGLERAWSVRSAVAAGLIRAEDRYERTTMRTKRPKGMKQTSPMVKTETMSENANLASVNSGCRIKKTINPLNNMLLWKSRPVPLT